MGRNLGIGAAHAIPDIRRSTRISFAGAGLEGINAYRAQSGDSEYARGPSLEQKEPGLSVEGLYRWSSGAGWDDSAVSARHGSWYQDAS